MNTNGEFYSFWSDCLIEVLFTYNIRVHGFLNLEKIDELEKEPLQG